MCARLPHTALMNINRVAHLAALTGEPSRTAMLLALMDGRALTARELAEAARISAATASRHLGLLVEARLLDVLSQGRHRYHRLASPEVARLLESLLQLASARPDQRWIAVGPADQAMRTARSCYDHVAGRLGVALSDHLIEQDAVRFDSDGGSAEVTGLAETALIKLGVPAGALAQSDNRRPPCRPCLDWSERRMHMAGRLGALICRHCLKNGWLLRTARTRALTITAPGAVALRHRLGLARWRFVVGD